MKKIVCITLLGYWMFVAAPGENGNQSLKRNKVKEQEEDRNQNARLTKIKVIYLDANGNILE